MAWITASDVAGFATWFASSATTTPTTTQVTAQIVFVEAEIQAALRAGGYSDAMTGAGTEGADANREDYAAHFRRMLKEIRTQPVLSADVKLTGAPAITEGMKSEWTEATDDMPEPWVSEDGEW